MNACCETLYCVRGFIVYQESVKTMHEIMMMLSKSSFFPLVIIFLLVGVESLDDNVGEECDIDALDAAFSSCKEANPAVCEQCSTNIPDPSENVLGLGAEWPEGSIDIANDLVKHQCQTPPTRFCSWIDCCPVCENEIKAYGECATNGIVRMLQSNPEIEVAADCEHILFSFDECSSSGGGENGGASFCDIDALDSVLSKCTEANPACEQCTANNIPDSSENVLGLGEEWPEGSIKVANDLVKHQCQAPPNTFCSWIDCCPVCKDEIQAFGACFTNSLVQMLQSDPEIDLPAADCEEVDINFDKCSTGKKDGTSGGVICLHTSVVGLSAIAVVLWIL